MTRISGLMIALRDGRQMLFDLWFDVYLAPSLRAEVEFNLNHRDGATTDAPFPDALSRRLDDDNFTFLSIFSHETRS